MPLVELSHRQLLFLTQLLGQNEELVSGNEELQALSQVLATGLQSSIPSLWPTPVPRQHMVEFLYLTFPFLLTFFLGNASHFSTSYPRNSCL